MGRGPRSFLFVAVKALVTVAITVSLLATQSPPALAVSPAYSSATQQSVRTEGDWILTAQLFDGSIANYTDKVAIVPYLANYASAGLVRATQVTGDSRY